MNMTDFNRIPVGPLLSLAQLSISLHKAQNAVAVARFDYLDRLKKFERKRGAVGRLDKNNAAHAAAIAYTADEYEALLAARRNAYNIKRRWQNACRKFN
ncbi:hypothetical protein [Duganella violaceipulchra]|uniref:Uncharacterized protein n=1 Tax=Duganella violaceipulchra TaxID=2849652 RepID=A0AA41L591_9BURK|nr:hypothetical protein [Duganella violaceicalia]MBV6321942.1 hypothetical protein [Duganella violaceicalia]MCP2007064.1 hypothetical protein [Duganella violaceicalia]